MRYTVVWKRSVEADLASIWLAAKDRDAVTQAAREIDAALREDASSKGESRFGNKRILVMPPLGVDFSVVEDDRIVRVLTVWRIRTGRSPT
jgi:plasmid stabilization system protein ParE